MAKKFTEKQVLDLFSDHLASRLKSDEDYLCSSNLSDYRLVIQSRISLMKDLLRTLQFYSNYEFEDIEDYE